MQPARIKPHAKEHTNNPVQRPHFRGQGKKKGNPKRPAVPAVPKFEPGQGIQTREETKGGGCATMVEDH